MVRRPEAVPPQWKLVVIRKPAPMAPSPPMSSHGLASNMYRVTTSNTPAAMRPNITALYSVDDSLVRFPLEALLGGVGRRTVLALRRPLDSGMGTRLTVFAAA